MVEGDAINRRLCWGLRLAIVFGWLAWRALDEPHLMRTITTWHEIVLKLKRPFREGMGTELA